MKKILSILLAISLLVCALGTVPMVTASAATTDSAPGFIYDFSTQAGVEKGDNAVWSSTIATYDAAEKAMKLTTKDASHNEPLAIVFWPAATNVTCAVADYPYVAIRYRVTSTNFKYAKTGVRSTGVADTTTFENWLKDSITYTDTEYHTAVLNTANRQWSGAVWGGNYDNVGFFFAGANELQENDAVYIEWIGVFKTQAAAENYDKNLKAPGYVYDYSVRANLNGVSVGGATKKAYDVKQGTVNITTTDTANESPLQILLSDAKLTAVESSEYPVIAVRVKTNNAKLSVRYLGLSNTTQWAEWYSSSVTFNYNGTTEWQTLICDTSKLKKTAKYAASGKYSRIILQLATPESVTEDTILSVKWAGTFKNVKAAEEYAETFDFQLYAPGFVYDFTNPENVNNSFVSVASNGAYSYDNNTGAMKVKVADANSNASTQICLSPAKKGWNADVGEYPVIAFRVRTSCPKIVYESTNLDTTRAESTSWNTHVITGTSYNGTAEWQTIVVDMSEYIYNGGVNPSGSWPWRAFTDNWETIKLHLAKAGTMAAEDAIYIQWAGVFSNIDAAKKYEASANDKKTGSRPSVVYDYTLEASLTTARESKNMSKAYDSYTKSAKITVADSASTDPITMILQYYTGSTADSTEYPVIALRVRLSDPSITAGKLYASTTNNTSWFGSYSKAFSYAATDEWQTVIIDTRGKNITGEYTALHFELANASSISAEDTISIQWVGIFKSAAEAAMFAGNWAESTADMNMDGAVNILDMIRFKKYLAGAVRTAPTLEMADLDEDKVIDVNDLSEFAKLLLAKK